MDLVGFNPTTETTEVYLKMVTGLLGLPALYPGPFWHSDVDQIITRDTYCMIP